MRDSAQLRCQAIGVVHVNVRGLKSAYESCVHHGDGGRCSAKAGALQLDLKGASGIVGAEELWLNDLSILLFDWSCVAAASS